jgi:hypothetical protein
MTKIHYTGKYLNTEIVKDCFKPNEITHVDKVLCGNGFTTAFLQLRPEKGMVNVLIMPNKGSVVSKDIQNLNPRAKFFYGGSTDFIDSNTDIVVSTTDSFLKLIETLKYRVELLLLDEFHTLIQSSSYRPLLKDYLAKMKYNFKEAAIVTVTASPLLLSKIDIQLVPEEITPIEIILNYNSKEVIAEIKERIAKNENVVVFTQSKSVIIELGKPSKTKKHTALISNVKAKLIVGGTLLQSIVNSVELDSSDKTFILSSAGFEGLDISLEDAHVFMLQDLNNINEQWLINNVYQAISRTRKGFKSCTYCRTDKLENYINIQEVCNKVFTKKYNDNKLLQGDFLKKCGLNWNEVKIFKSILTIDYDYLGHPIVYRNMDLYRLYKENLIWITKGFDAPEYKSFLSDRNITINNSKIVQSKRDLSYTLNDEHYLKYNSKIIEANEFHKSSFYFNHKVNLYNRTITGEFLKQFTKHLKLKNYNGEYILNSKENKVLELLKTDIQGHYTVINDLFRNLILNYTERKRPGTRTKSKLIVWEQEVEQFKETLNVNFLRLLGTLVNDDIIFPENGDSENGHRVYNILTSSSLDIIAKVCEVLQVRCVELDIKSCNPRIIYAAAGETLPSNFYGVDKVNKTAINILLNSFTYDWYIKRQKKIGKTVSVPLHKHKSRKIQEFKTLGFSDTVITWLFDNFYNEESIRLFNYCTFKEKELINNVRVHLNRGGYRRHDSVLFFNSDVICDVSNFNFLSQVNWFNELTIINDAKTIEVNKYLYSDDTDECGAEIEEGDYYTNEDFLKSEIDYNMIYANAEIE